jgi:ferredoxin
MPLIRFVREGRDVECYPGENLREVALREGIALYGIKGILGNCGGCGQCITCFVELPEDSPVTALSPRTGVEEQKLRNRPRTWRLACQALVQQSLVVLTRPQVGLQDKEAAFARAQAEPLAAGPLSWPEPSEAEADAAEATASELTAGAPAEPGLTDAPEPRGSATRASTTADEAP